MGVPTQRHMHAYVPFPVVASALFRIGARAGPLTRPSLVRARAHPATHSTEVFCPSRSSGAVDGYAAWSLTSAGIAAQNITSTNCSPGYAGTPWRLCNSDGTWGPVNSACQRTRSQPTSAKRSKRMCLIMSPHPLRVPALRAARKCLGSNNPYNAATWADTAAGQTGQGTCNVNNGFTGTATAPCSIDGVWGAVTTQCTAAALPCPQVVGYQGVSGFTNWPSTTAGTTAIGTCANGYTFGPNGAPSRQCLATSVWSTTVMNDCIFSACPGLARKRARGGEG